MPIPNSDSSRSMAPAPVFGVALAIFLGLLGGVAGAGELEDRLDRKEGQLGKVQERQGILTSALEEMNAEIGRLESEVSGLRSQEAAVEADLAAKQLELDSAAADLERSREHLQEVADRLRRALVVLRERLIAIYEAGSPDIVSTVLAAGDWSDAVAASEYVNRIQESDDALVDRVSGLRDEAEEDVARQRRLRDQIEAARDAIAAREAELESTRLDLEAQEIGLRGARSERRQSLAKLDERESVLEGDVSHLQAEIQAQLGEVQVGPFPPGPTSAPGTFVFPVSGTVTSGFGYRWGRQHEGLDIGAAEGTPIWAAADGTVVLQQGEAESGGYGNFTCLEHSSGIATCYAHQSAFNVSAGQRVSQGEVIGLVGNTGNSFGAHLHFEVRVGGVAQDPLGYL